MKLPSYYADCICRAHDCDGTMMLMCKCNWLNLGRSVYSDNSFPINKHHTLTLWQINHWMSTEKPHQTTSAGNSVLNEYDHVKSMWLSHIHSFIQCGKSTLNGCGRGCCRDILIRGPLWGRYSDYPIPMACDNTYTTTMSLSPAVGAVYVAVTSWLGGPCLCAIADWN